MAGKLVALTIICGIVVMDAAAPADATFPGRNGRIAYPTSAGISTVRPDGSDATPLVNIGGARDPAWSADGKQLAFAAPGRSGHLLIYVVSASGKHLRRVSRTGVDRFDPSWAPDGKHLAVLGRLPAVEGTNTAGLYVLGIGGRREKQIATTVADTNFGDAEWSPDGTAIAFTDTLDLFLVSPSGGARMQVTHQPAATTSSPDRPVRELSWGPGARRIAFSEEWNCPCDDDINLAVIRRNGSGRHDFDSSATERDPLWSPDRKAINLCHYEPFVTPKSLWTMQPDGGSPDQVLNDGGCDAAWQPLPRKRPH